MTQDDVENIEAQLHIVLPQPYIQAALAGQFADPIHDDAQSIIGINSAFRAGDFGDEDWRGHLIAIGHDGAGNYFCLDTESPESGVYVRDHETLNISKQFDSFAAFLSAWA